MLRIISCALLAICMSSSEKYLFRCSAHIWLDCLFFDVELLLLVSHFSICCLYILDINSLIIASFANIFSHFVSCLFIWFMVSFALQKLLSLIRSHLFIFVFIFIIKEADHKRSSCNLCQRVVCLCFLQKFYSSWSYI